MTRHPARNRHDSARRRGVDQTVAASALAGGLFAVVALWKTASEAAAAGVAGR